MNKANELSARFTARTDKDRQVIEQLLATLGTEVFEEWESKLVVRNGLVAGSHYARLADTLTFAQFVSLHEALGYEMPRPQCFDCRCVVTEETVGCVPDRGYMCLPENCCPQRT